MITVAGIAPLITSIRLLLHLCIIKIVTTSLNIPYNTAKPTASPTLSPIMHPAVLHEPLLALEPDETLLLARRYLPSRLQSDL